MFRSKTKQNQFHITAARRPALCYTLKMCTKCEPPIIEPRPLTEAFHSPALLGMRAGIKWRCPIEPGAIRSRINRLYAGAALAISPGFAGVWERVEEGGFE